MILINKFFIDPLKINYIAATLSACYYFYVSKAPHIDKQKLYKILIIKKKIKILTTFSIKVVSLKILF
jgi:hypothetical protein